LCSAKTVVLLNGVVKEVSDKVIPSSHYCFWLLLDCSNTLSMMSGIDSYGLDYLIVQYAYDTLIILHAEENKLDTLN
jgi:hypothetical protein